MKFLIVASLIAVAFARPSFYETGKHIAVSDDGTITINNNHGQTVVLTHQVHHPTGLKNVDITLTGANTLTKHIQVNDNIHHQEAYPWLRHDDAFWSTNGDDDVQTDSHDDFLVHILRKYQGGVDDITYHKLLAMVARAVEHGLVGREVYEVLVGLEHHNWEDFGDYEHHQEFDGYMRPQEAEGQHYYGPQQWHEEFDGYKHHPYHNDEVQHYYGPQQWNGVYGDYDSEHFAPSHHGEDSYYNNYLSEHHQHQGPEEHFAWKQYHGAGPKPYYGFEHRQYVPTVY